MSTDVVPSFGKCLLPLFSVSPSNHSINFGSYGCPPRAVLAQRMKLMQGIDDNTEVFFRTSGEVDTENVRRQVAEFIGLSNPDHIVMVDNAAAAFNTIAQSLIHNPSGAQKVLGRRRVSVASQQQEETTATCTSSVKLLLFDRQYPMCKAAIQHWNAHASSAAYNIAESLEEAQSEVSVRKALADRVRYHCGYVDVDEVTTTFDLVVNSTDAQLARTLASRIVEGKCNYFVIDHVCWSPAIVFPIVEICTEIRKLERDAGVPLGDRCVVIIDGAHAIGNIDLKPIFAAQEAQLASSNGTIPLFDAFLSNCHKWLMAPKSVAILYTAPMWHAVVHPVVIGNNYRNHSAEESSTDATSKLMQREFFCPGTRDHSAYLVVGDTIAFRRDVLGGEARIREYCFDLAYRAAEAIAARWSSGLVITEKSRLCSMTNAFCPPSMSPDDARHVIGVMLSRYQCFGAIGELEGRPFIRISAQVYQELEDFERFADLFLEVALSEGLLSKVAQ